MTMGLSAKAETGSVPITVKHVARNIVRTEFRLIMKISSFQSIGDSHASSVADA
jgi:hypothetical protein